MKYETKMEQMLLELGASDSNEWHVRRSNQPNNVSVHELSQINQSINPFCIHICIGNSLDCCRTHKALVMEFWSMRDRRVIRFFLERCLLNLTDYNDSYKPRISFATGPSTMVDIRASRM